jgi:hypothetical protein
MTKAWKLLLVLGLLWAAFASAYLWYRDIQDEQYRKLRALAAVRLGASADEDATNDTVRIPRASVAMVADLAQAEERRSTMFTTIAWISSGFIVLLSVCALSTTQKHEVTPAELECCCGDHAHANPPSSF